MKIVITLSVVSVCLVCVLYGLHLRAFKRRVLYDRNDILNVYGVSEDNYALLQNVLKLIGKCYGVDYRQLRPTDSFNGNLKHLDSWILDASNEKLSAELLKRGVSDLEKIHSVGDAVNALIKRA